MYHITEEIGTYLVNNLIRAGRSYIFTDPHDKTFPTTPLLTEYKTNSWICSLVSDYQPCVLTFTFRIFLNAVFFIYSFIKIKTSSGNEANEQLAEIACE